MKKGFTLIELLVVIAIIGILSVVAVVNLNNARNKAKVAAAKAWGASLSGAVVLCQDKSNTAALTAYDDVAPISDICSSAVGQLWPTAPTGYTVCVADGLSGDTGIQDGTWTINLESTDATAADPGAWENISCNQNGCANATDQLNTLCP